MTVTSFNPRDGQVRGTVRDTSSDEVDATVRRAAAVARSVGDAAPSERRRWLYAIAAALDAHNDELARLADAETALGMPRLTGEMARTANQLRFYGDVAAEGAYLGASLEDATDSTPRFVRINRPLGPVAVFGASNFPAAFGVLGNDTASALAAGCPVVAKAHPAHVLTCLRLAEVAREALADAGAPNGAYSLVTGMDAGRDLVQHPEVKVVAFTGSQSGGLALWRLANQREVVIPVYAEMGTVNPVVLTTNGADNLEEVACGFVGSFTLGQGQFCVKPGLFFAPAGVGAVEAIASALEKAAPSPHMLTKAIAENVHAGLLELQAAGAQLVHKVAGPANGWSADAAVLSAPISAMKPGSRLLEECFGPVAVVVEYADQRELDDALATLQGSLAGAVFGGGDDDAEAAHAIDILSTQVGRVTVGTWPTGVAANWSQQHGGPWPATSNPSSSSVGAAALDRFVRGVTFQSTPDAALPPPVRAAIAADNPWGITRRVNGRLQTP